MWFHQLLDKLEWSDYSRPLIEVDSSKYKFKCGRWMSSRLHNEIDAREDHAYYMCHLQWLTIIGKHVLINNICMTKQIFVMIYYYIFVKHIKLI
jgi:hypothetical protein